MFPVELHADRSSLGRIVSLRRQRAARTSLHFTLVTARRVLEIPNGRSARSGKREADQRESRDGRRGIELSLSLCHFSDTFSLPNFERFGNYGIIFSSSRLPAEQSCLASQLAAHFFPRALARVSSLFFPLSHAPERSERGWGTLRSFRRHVICSSISFACAANLSPTEDIFASSKTRVPRVLRIRRSIVKSRLGGSRDVPTGESP